MPEYDFGPKSNLATDTRDLLAKLAEAQHAERTSSDLTDRIKAVVTRGRQPDQLERPDFQQRVAYVLEDVEKSRFGRIEVSPGLREELTRLAGSAPGLENERMRALLQATGSIENRQLVADIRRTATDVGRRADQDSPAVVSQIETLENRTRLAAKLPTAAEAPAPATPSVPPGSAPSQTAGPAGQPVTASGRAIAAYGPTQPLGPEGNAAAAAETINRVNPQATAGGQRFYPNPPSTQATVQSSALDTILRAMRPARADTPPPWTPPATSMVERFAAFEQKTQSAGEDRTFRRAETSGRMALDALQHFASTEGAAVMGRINAAAQSDPGGMAAVMAGMRDGGRYADLRQQFNGAVRTERGAEAYTGAQGALAGYERDRTAAQNIIVNHPEAAALAARFAEMDAKVGKAASTTPSATEGRSMVEDLSKHVTELLTRAAEAVRNALGRSPLPDAGARASPSPSPAPG